MNILAHGVIYLVALTHEVERLFFFFKKYKHSRVKVPEKCLTIFEILLLSSQKAENSTSILIKDLASRGIGRLGGTDWTNYYN